MTTKKTYHKSLMRFRQDIRTYDNTALFHACQQSEEVIPVFVLDTKFFARKEDQRLGFLYEALSCLEGELKAKGSQLIVLAGNPAEEIMKFAESQQVDGIFLNDSYGDGSEKRDDIVQQRARENGVGYHGYLDYLLVEPSQVEQRKVYTPFYKKRIPHVEAAHSTWSPLLIDTITTPETTGPQLVDHKSSFPAEHHPLRCIQGVREKMQKSDHFDYDQTRNIPASMTGTTRLSPYLNFGILSPRECYAHFAASPSEGHEIVIKELGWREFRQHVAHYFPWTKTEEFQEKRKNIQRENKKEWFEAWKEGRTGYPLVDAGMRQLREENRMHNRVRMVVASFLTKDLLIDRRWGEEHFARYLIDYDRNVNIGNRQRSASVGPDPKPLRIFNPILQSKRFDPAAEYIFRYVPEVKGQPIAAIHDPIKYALDYHPIIMDHYVWSKEAKKRYNESKAIYLAEKEKQEAESSS